MSGGPDHPNPPSIVDNAVDGWVAVQDEDLVYLEVGVAHSTTDGLQVTSANIKVGTDFAEAGAAWSDGAYVEDDGDPTNPRQTFARIALGKMVGTRIRQYVTTNLIMRQVCINGKAAIYPMPY